ncbi:flagellar basal-body rod protein FlgB [Desulfobaculum xiamenense]|uniref:Flagellar basal body rod protein FlgB n=1 Tax=Desulfobaculum xiamenense TaxID=995050 RepID=A0A846QVU1_9BACT|nr:flagellar basal body rod protein FlgB [Desulfobaculum xiamenense]NJB69234.1 flagellar basal-body rod protein FlgB [Desulfobaculum xiamenense]
MKSLFGSHINLTAKVLDMRLMRQNVVMSNLSNITTPNYKVQRLEFEKDLQAALDLDARGKMTRTQADHIPHVFEAGQFGPDLASNLKHRVIHGEDNVDLDKEMSIMAKNSLAYNALTTVIKKNFEGMTNIISEGGR